MGFQLGNQIGSKSRHVERILRQLVEQDEEILRDRSRLRLGCQALLDRAAEGDQWAMQFIAERLDGKPRQQVDMDVSVTLSSIGVLARQAIADEAIEAIEAEAIGHDEAA